MSKLNINFNNQNYEIDPSALSDVRSDFISHLGTIAGDGLKLIIDGVEYSVDPTKLNDASASLEAVLSSLSGGGNEPEGLTNIYWDGNIEGLDIVTSSDLGGTIMCWARVSDKYISSAEVLGSTIAFKNGDDPDIEFVVDDASVSTKVNGATFTDTQTYCVKLYGAVDMVMWVHSDETALLDNGESIEFKAGTWLFCGIQNDVVTQYVKSVEFPTSSN